MFYISAIEDNQIIYLEGAFKGNGELLPRTIPGEPGNLEFTFEVGRVGEIEQWLFGRAKPLV